MAVSGAAQGQTSAQISALPTDDLQVAILGDSISTGAATHPALAFDSVELWNVFTGTTSVAPRRADLPADLPVALADPMAPPVRLWPGPREFFGGPDWLWRNTMQSLSRAYLDTEEYSWGYMVAAGLGVAPSRLLIAAEDGSRAAVMTRHVDRVLAATGGLIPDKLFVLYTGNDLCGLSLSQASTPNGFEADLVRGFEYLLRAGTPKAGGADVYVLSFLGMLQLLHDDDILAKNVRAFGGQLTCKALREQGYRPKDPAQPAALPPDAWWFGTFMPPNPSAFCPTVFGGVGPEKDETINALANRIREFREREDKVVSRMNERSQRKGGAVRFHFVTQTADLIFKGDDIAQDCFHLSAAGQARLAKAVLSALGR